MVRQATLDDAEAIIDLTRQLGYQLPDQQILANLEEMLNDDRRVVLVLVIESQVVGWCTVVADIAITEPPYALLSGMVVDEALRGNGLGRELLMAAEAWARDRGLARIRLRTNLVRAGAQAFYERGGYETVKEQRVYTKAL
ncbi:MAG: GNAT family N-acetyltransferase [Chlorobia bacterium]|nr:GNAT family N-acetyltransferase [Fimbriimonadaceae bacterium]